MRRYQQRLDAGLCCWTPRHWSLFRATPGPARATHRLHTIKGAAVFLISKWGVQFAVDVGVRLMLCVQGVNLLPSLSRRCRIVGSWVRLKPDPLSVPRFPPGQVRSLERRPLRPLAALGLRDGHPGQRSPATTQCGVSRATPCQVEGCPPVPAPRCPCLRARSRNGLEPCFARGAGGPKKLHLTFAKSGSWSQGAMEMRMKMRKQIEGIRGC